MIYDFFDFRPWSLMAEIYFSGLAKILIIILDVYDFERLFWENHLPTPSFSHYSYTSP